MNLTQFAMGFGLLTLGILIGMFVTAVMVGRRDDAEVLAAPEPRDTTLVNYLERSECNLFFNPGMGAWGLLDGSNKMLATAHTVRNTLGRAMDKDSEVVV